MQQKDPQQQIQIPQKPVLLEKDLAELEELTDEQIDFVAIHHGLGFRPMGTGAEVASSTITPVLNKSESITPKEPSYTAHISDAGVSIALRSYAMALDLLIIGTPLALVLRHSIGRGHLINIVKQGKSDLLLFVLSYFLVYFILTESLGGQSIGKMLLKLRVVEDDKYQKPIGFKIALFRSICLVFSVLPFGLGLLAAFKDKKARQWHDKITRSIIRKIN